MFPVEFAVLCIILAKLSGKRKKKKKKNKEKKEKKDKKKAYLRELGQMWYKLQISTS